MKKYLNKETINTISPLKIGEVEIPEMDLIVKIKELSIAQVLQVKEMSGENQEKNTYKLIAMSVVDEKGERLVSDEDAESVFGEWSISAINTINNAISAINNINVDEKVKNLKNDPLAD